MNGEHKITSSHRERAALIYLRQSSMAQVREHTESTRSQYGLAETAAGLGWARTSIEVIDTDLGISGKWGVAREGFTELVTRMCRGDVGAIFGIEITRLARSNADVARLAEFARITGTLLIDPDGVYDPADVNDRVLLGFKGTMGEMELHVMAQRLQANKRAAAGRGELRTPLPVGYVHDDAGDVVIDPDAEVQAAIRDVFAAFAACGSAYGVVAAFAGRRFPLRAYGGAWAGQLRWGRLTHARVLGILKNPGYAGAYVFGRYASHRTVDPSGTVHTAITERPRAEWPVLIKDHHEGYITWADYLASEARLAANHTAAGARPPREGTALCQGIISCGSCGKPMMTNYHTDQRPSYECSSRRDRLTTPSCRSVAAACVDDAVAGALLDALTPGRSPWRCQPPTRWRAGTSGSAGPPSSPSSVPATTPTGPSARSARSSRKTGWSPAPWRPAGRPGSPPWPKPSRRCRPPRTRCRRCPAGTTWRNSPLTCPPCGTRPPPAPGTANGCCAP